MSKELVISAASHERRVAILEEGQLVEIYIEREKEFALVGSIYKGKVTRVLPGMQSAFENIGLDGDAFLYVSDVFENLEDYDSGHAHEQPQASAPAPPPANGSPVELLPGESLARAAKHHEEAHREEYRGRGGRWGRRGGRHRGGRPQGGPGGRNLPPSKYASPQGGESRGYENRGAQPRSYDNRRSDVPRPPVPNVTEEEIILPGESLAKYRGKPAVAPTPAPSVETHEEQAAVEEITPRTTATLPATAPSGSSVPRRFSGGLPRWLLADAGAEAEAASAGEAATEEASAAGSARAEPSLATAGNSMEAARNDVELDEDQVAALASGFVEAKHEETQEEAEADAVVGGAEFDEEETEGQTEEVEETIVAEVSQLSEEEAEEVEAGRAADRAEFAADVAQEHAEHDAAQEAHGHGEHEHVENEPAEMGHVEEEPVAEGTATLEEVILLPGETRAPRTGGPAAPRADFPRDSARIGGNPRSRCQRPFRSGGRDRGRDSRGGRPDSRGGRPDSRGSRPDRGGRPSRGPRL